MGWCPVCGRLFVLNKDGTTRYFHGSVHTWSGNGIVDVTDRNCPDHARFDDQDPNPFPYTEPI